MSRAWDSLVQALNTPKGERLPDSALIQGYQGTAFFGAGMIVLMRCGPCDGDRCAECEWTGTVLVHIPEKDL